MPLLPDCLSKFPSPSLPLHPRTPASAEGPKRWHALKCKHHLTENVTDNVTDKTVFHESSPALSFPCLPMQDPKQDYWSKLTLLQTTILPPPAHSENLAGTCWTIDSKCELTFRRKDPLSHPDDNPSLWVPRHARACSIPVPDVFGISMDKVASRWQLGQGCTT